MSSSSMEPIANILNSSIKGIAYFRSKDPKDADAKDYVLFRTSGAYHSPGCIAKEWNDFMIRFKNCDSLAWRDFANDALILTKTMVTQWSNDNNKDEFSETSVDDSSVVETTSSDSVSSTSSESIVSGAKITQQPKRNGSIKSGKRKKHAFTIYFKEPSTINISNEDSPVESSHCSSGLLAAFKDFQKSSTKLILPDRDISSLLPEALSLNGIWWIDKVPLNMSNKEHMLHITSLRSVHSPSPDDDLQLLCFNVQSMLQSPLSEEELIEYMDGLSLNAKGLKKRQAVKVLDRLVDILPTIYQADEEQGEMGFILTRLHCFLDVLFGQRSCFTILYNIEHDSGNATKSGHDKGVRADFFIEVPCRSFSSVFNSEIVGLLGEVKPPEKERRKTVRIQDFWKLVRMGKDEINSQISKGVVSPMVILIQVFGFQLEMFLMTMDPNEGLYKLHNAANGYLPRSGEDLPLVGNIISIFQHAKVTNPLTTNDCRTMDLKPDAELLALYPAMDRRKFYALPAYDDPDREAATEARDERDITLHACPRNKLQNYTAPAPMEITWPEK
ncbi:hypothetical protein BGZ46_003943 [Entomortierella lignicola]|nr:hypothetical protein BGZ46_003943 [Entomortierella lignicola]